MSDQESLEYALVALKNAQDQMYGVDGMRDVRNNLDYIIDDVEQALKQIKEKEL